MTKFFKKLENDNKKLWVKRESLLNQLRDYVKVAIVHAVPKTSTFIKIINEGSIKLPSQTDIIKKTPLMEQYFGFDNCIYLSVGFTYATAYGWKYSLIFKGSILKDLTYLKNSLGFSCYNATLRYLHENDKQYLKKAMNQRRKGAKILRAYILNDGLLKFWEDESFFFQLVTKYPKKKEIEFVLKKTLRNLKTSYPLSKKDASQAIKQQRVPEVLGRNQISLKKNPHFLGFYIEGSIPKKVMDSLKKNYTGKIIFDGKKIWTIE